jgi:hypothetical protein
MFVMCTNVLQFILSSVPKVKSSKFDDFCSLAWRSVGISLDQLRKVGYGGKMRGGV